MLSASDILHVHVCRMYMFDVVFQACNYDMYISANSRLHID
jgi:hypothetical protein